MDRSSETADFLRSRRAMLTPGAGLSADGRTRRVPGLRRDEVARLAGVSTEYYTRLEQGRAGSPSQEVVEALARALQLDPSEHEHLSRARPPRERRSAVRPTSGRVRCPVGVADEDTWGSSIVGYGGRSGAAVP
nr:helix-turn-helix transcriptional regulator [Streptomyces sp. S1D4-11]